jgi:superfamily II DNA or RNA helicase
VLSGRIEHCAALAEALNEAGTEAVALTGELSARQRAAALTRFREGDLKVLCATNLADEGLDVGRLECVILTTPTRAEGRTLQRLGRLMRPYPGKQQPVLYDLVDADFISKSQFRARKRAYRRVMGDRVLPVGGRTP